MSLKSHLLFICHNMFRPHGAIIRQPFIDLNSRIQRYVMIGRKYIDVCAHAVQGFRPINGCLMMAPWGRNTLRQINRKRDFMTFLRNFKCDCDF
jgi:hypothetical protein